MCFVDQFSALKTSEKSFRPVTPRVSKTFLTHEGLLNGRWTHMNFRLFISGWVTDGLRVGTIITSSSPRNVGLFVEPFPGLVSVASGRPKYVSDPDRSGRCSLSLGCTCPALLGKVARLDSLRDRETFKKIPLSSGAGFDCGATGVGGASGTAIEGDVSTDVPISLAGAVTLKSPLVLLVYEAFFEERENEIEPFLLFLSFEFVACAPGGKSEEALCLLRRKSLSSGSRS